LETKHKAGESYKRLRALEEFTDGFKLAELDLKYRGAGEFL
jgi:RecG-like helicase